MRLVPIFVLLTTLVLSPRLIRAQQQKPDDMPGMDMSSGAKEKEKPQNDGTKPGMQGMPGMEPDKNAPEAKQPNSTGNSQAHTPVSALISMNPQTFLQAIVRHAASGTGVEPDSTPAPMWMFPKGSWMLMFHANVFVLDEQQSGPRGADKFFSTNWAMGMAQRTAGPGVFTVRTMLSAEPATVTHRLYPLLFQEGETAFGKSIVDGQHPHDLFMELAVLYDFAIGRNALLSFYAAPIGDPAIGPVAYAHRSSAAENPVATLGHHQEDSTHIASDVVTAGLAYRNVRIEASGFHGREPNENRWNIDQGKLDSWSTRVTIQPGKQWSAQASYARIASPEARVPTENQSRITASVSNHQGFANGDWSSTLAWGRTRSAPGGSIFNSYTLESTLRFKTANYLWTRVENVDRSAELIPSGTGSALSSGESSIGRVQSYTAGFDHEFRFVPGLSTAAGAAIAAYGVPDSLKPYYGSHPAGLVLFIRFRPESSRKR